MSAATPVIVDRLGNPMVVKAATVPNLDPGFFMMSSNDRKESARNVVNRAYAYHVWVYRCVRAIINSVATLERLLQEKKGGRYVEDHAVLRLLEKPNQLMTKVPFFELIISMLLLPVDKRGASSGGQCFLIPWNRAKDDKVRLDKGEIPDELFPYPDSFFEPVYEQAGGGRKALKGWRFTIDHRPGTEIDFDHGEIIRIYMVNPYDLLKGVSPFSSVASAVELDAQADIYNKAIFANNGQLDGSVTSDQFVPKEELDKLREEWYKSYTGTDRRRVAFLSGGLKYVQHSLSSVDLDYVNQEKWTRQKVLGAYGMNRIGVGDYEDINYATIREGRKLLWYDTYIPIDKLINNALNGQMLDFVEQGRYRLVSDYSKVPALQGDMQERVKTAGIMTTQLNYPPVLASRIMEIPLKEDDVERWPHLAEQPVKPVAGFNPGQEGAFIKAKAMQTRDYSEDYIERVLEPAERSFRKDLDRFFVAQRNAIMDNVDRWRDKNKGVKAVSKEATYGVSAWEFLPDEIKEDQELMRLYFSGAKNQATLEKRQVEQELDHVIQWDDSDQRVQIMASSRTPYLQDINTNTFNIARDAIDATIKQSLADNLTPAEAAKKVKEAVHAVYEVRMGRAPAPHGDFDLSGMSSSLTIARTEMGVIASMSRFDMFKSEGIEKIEWVTAQDDRVRESHAAVDGEVIEIQGQFANGLRYPRDPNGPPEEIINCRCGYVAVTGTGE